MNALRKSTIIKFLTTLSLALMVLLSISLTSNTAQAAKVKPIYMLQTSKQYNHYIKLAKRKGTHYFKGHYVALYGFGGVKSIVAKGTKTVHGKHYFIDKYGAIRYPDSNIDFQIKNFYQPTAYKVVSKSKLADYGLPGVDYTDSNELTHYDDTDIKPGTKILVTKHQKYIVKGITYYNAYEPDGCFAGHIKASDMKKLKKTNITQPTYYGNKPNWVFHGSKLVHGLRSVLTDRYHPLYKMKHVMD